VTAGQRLSSAALVVGIVSVMLIGSTVASTASFGDAATSTGIATTETLDPPTSMAASAVGTTVLLTWLPSPDAAVAVGYQVLRAIASGGPFSQVGAVTPGTATTTTDIVPASGTYYYALRTYAGDAPWTSASSSARSVVVAVTVTTAWGSCTSQGAVTSGSGDNDGYQTNPGEACDDDSVYAVDANSGTNASPNCDHNGKDRHRFWGFSLGLPGSVASIDGIEVRADLRVDSASSNPTACLRLSWDGGTSWTDFVQIGSMLTTSETTYTVGGAADRWGRTSWSASELASPAFQVEITDVAQSTARDFSLDGLKVRVTYTP
jgi:hypothetical protein